MGNITSSIVGALILDSIEQVSNVIILQTDTVLPHFLCTQSGSLADLSRSIESRRFPPHNLNAIFESKTKSSLT